MAEGDGGDGASDGGNSPSSPSNDSQASFDQGIGAILGAVFGDGNDGNTTTDSEGNTTVSPGSASRGPQSNSEAMQAARAAVEALQQQAAEQQARAEQAQAKANEAKARAEEAARNAKNPTVEAAKDAMGEKFGKQVAGSQLLADAFKSEFPGVTEEDVAEASIVGGFTIRGAAKAGRRGSNANPALEAMKSYLRGKQNAKDAANEAAAAEKAAQEAAAAAEAAKDKAQKAADLLAQVEDIFAGLEDGGSYTEDGVTVDSEDMDSEGHFGTPGFGDYTVPVGGNVGAHYTTHVWDSAHDMRTGLMYIMVGKQTIDRGDLFQ